MATREIARFEGTETVIANLKKVQARVLDKALKPAYMAAGVLVRDEAEQRAPVRTGFLAHNMVAEWDGRKRVVRVGPHKDAYYGYFQEFGTAKMSPHPFLRPALDAKEGEAFAAMAKEINKVLEQPL